jgi:uncharacterized protein YdaU (DUF1376 family)
MDKKGKYQPWSHEEFLADRHVRAMTPTARKVYMLLLHEAWFCETRPYLPDDEKTLKLLADCESSEEWERVKLSVLTMFEPLDLNGVPVLSQKRLVEDWDHLQALRTSKQENGRAGGLAKARNRKEDDDVKTDGLLLICNNIFGRRARLSGRNGEGLRELFLVHKKSAVERAFEEWAMSKSDDLDIQDPIAAFLSVAEDYLVTETATTQAVDNPNVKTLTREISALTDGKVTFVDKHRIRLAKLLSEYSVVELIAAWKHWIETQDADEPKFWAGKFVQAADDVCYAIRKKNELEATETRTRTETAAKLKAEAEATKPEPEPDDLLEGVEI